MDVTEPNRYTDENGVTYVAKRRDAQPQGDLFDDDQFKLSFEWVVAK
jgi:hypothetical protein